MAAFAGFFALIYIATIVGSFWLFKRLIEKTFNLPDHRFTEMPLEFAAVCIFAASSVPSAIVDLIELCIKAFVRLS